MTMLLMDSRERTRFLRFLVVGLIGAGVDFGVMNLLVSLFSMPLIIAGTISFIAAIISNFTWNRYWTYPDSRSKKISHQLVEFSIVSIVGLTIRVAIIALLEPIITKLVHSLLNSFNSITLDFLSHNLTLAFSVVIVMLWNFFINRYWTYGDIE